MSIRPIRSMRGAIYAALKITYGLASACPLSRGGTLEKLSGYFSSSISIRELLDSGLIFISFFSSS